VKVRSRSPEHVAEIVERRRERDERCDEDDALLKLAELADQFVDVVRTRRKSC